MGRELKELCRSAFKRLKHDYFYIDEGDKLATALQSYMRRKVVLARMDKMSNERA